MSIPAVLGLLLFLSVAGNGILAKLYVGEGKKLAAIEQKFDSFKASVSEQGKQAKEDAESKKKEDAKRKEDADRENKTAVDRLHADIVRLRRERDSSRGSIVPAAPAGSKCPDGQACFDAAGLERALRERRDAVRGLADEAAAVEADLNTARRWARP